MSYSQLEKKKKKKNVWSFCHQTFRLIHSMSSILVTSFGSICLIAQLKRSSPEATFCCLQCTVYMRVCVCDQKWSALFIQMGLVKMENVPCVSG